MRKLFSIVVPALFSLVLLGASSVASAQLQNCNNIGGAILMGNPYTREACAALNHPGGPTFMCGNACWRATGVCPEGTTWNFDAQVCEEPEPPEPENCADLAGQTVRLTYAYSDPSPTSHNGCEIRATGVEVCPGAPPTSCTGDFQYTGAPGGGGGGGPGDGGGEPGGGDGGGEPGGGDGGGEPGGGDGGGEPGGGDGGGGECAESDENCTPGGGGDGTGGDGTGDGKDKASSGLSCSVQPQCTGPAVECATFFETWRNRCANPMVSEIADDTQKLITDGITQTGDQVLESYEEALTASLGSDSGFGLDPDLGTSLISTLTGQACVNYMVDIPNPIRGGATGRFGLNCSETRVVRDVLGFGFAVLVAFHIYSLARKPVAV